MNGRTTVRLLPGLLDCAKRKARAENCTLTSLIDEGLRWVVASRRKANRAERVLPRVSTASGGLRPGVDLTHMSELREIDDLAYARRVIDRA